MEISGTVASLKSCHESFLLLPPNTWSLHAGWSTIHVLKPLPGLSVFLCWKLVLKFFFFGVSPAEWFILLRKNHWSFRKDFSIYITPPRHSSSNIGRHRAKEQRKPLDLISNQGSLLTNFTRSHLFQVTWNMIMIEQILDTKIQPVLLEFIL